MIGQMDVALYNRARSQGRRGRVWSALTGRSRRLLPLAEIDTACIAHACRCASIRIVPISHIRGSQGRSKDFDRDFNPLQGHTKDRWLGVAAARQREKSLPPVELIQVGDVYFVRDGHHRVSVAQALGQQDIEAEVTLWQVTGPLQAGEGWRRASSALPAGPQRPPDCGVDGAESAGRLPCWRWGVIHCTCLMAGALEWPAPSCHNAISANSLYINHGNVASVSRLWLCPVTAG